MSRPQVHAERFRHEDMKRSERITLEDVPMELHPTGPLSLWDVYVDAAHVQVAASTERAARIIGREVIALK